MKKLLLLSASALLWSVGAWGQSTGAIDVNVTDSAGAAIPGAQVQLFQPRLGAPVIAKAVSDAAGLVRFTELAPGAYRINASAEGFVSAEVSVTVAAGKTQKLTVPLSELHPRKAGRYRKTSK